MDVGIAKAGHSYDEPLHREEEGRPHQDIWWRPSLWGSAPYRWDVDLDDQDATRVAWTISGACGSVLGFFGTCGRLQEPQEGQRLAQWMMIMPQQGQRLPYRGLTPSFSAHFDILARKSDKLIELCIVSLVGCFVDLFL